MKTVKRWLLPALTCLIVVAAVLLPPYLSQMRDRGLTDTDHTEAVNGDRLSLKEATLEQRIGLLYRWENGEQIDAVTQPFSNEELERDIQPAVFESYDELCREVPTLASALDWWAPGEVTGSRLLLRDAAGGLSASMLQLRGTFPDAELIIDERTGLVLSLTVDRMPTTPDSVDTGGCADCAWEYLSYLGIDGEMVSSGETTAILRLPACGVDYLFQNEVGEIAIGPFAGASNFEITG